MMKARLGGTEYELFLSSNVARVHRIQSDGKEVDFFFPTELLDQYAVAKVAAAAKRILTGN